MLNVPDVFGDQTVAIVTVEEAGTPEWGGLKRKTRTAVSTSGCRFRPLTSTETPDGQTDVATEIWKLTAPPAAAILAAKPNGELIYDGSDAPEDLDLESDEGKAATFQIHGPIQPKRDPDGVLHHVTITCKRQAG